MARVPYTNLLEEALEAWGWARDGVIAEVRNLPARALDFRPTPEMRSVRELVVHIVENSCMMVGELTRPDGDFTRKSYAALVREHTRGLPRPRSKSQCVALLRATYRDGARRFKAAGEILMLQTIRRFDGLPGTRLAWLYHGIAHEEYHRAQLAVYARLLGRVPALTKAIEGG